MPSSASNPVPINNARLIPASRAMGELERLPHLCQKTIALWGTPELDAFLAHLMMDSREGTRQGLPLGVAAEVLFLAQTNKLVRAIDLAKRTGLNLEEAFRRVDEADQKQLKIDPLDDPLVSRDTLLRDEQRQGVSRHGHAKHGRTSPANQVSGLFALLRMLLVNRWVLGPIVLALAYRHLWPSLQALL